MRKVTLFTLCVTLILATVGLGLIFPFLPGVARELGASDFVAMLLGTIYAVGMFLFSRFWGELSDRRGRRPALLVSVSMSAVGLVILWQASSIWMLFVARAIEGVAAGNTSVVSAYVADVTSKEERAKGLGLVGAVAAFGTILGPILGGLLEAHSPLEREGAFSALVAAGLTAINLVLLLAFLPESLPVEKRAQRTVRLAPIQWDRIRASLALPGMGILVAIACARMVSISGLQQTFRLFTLDEFGFTVEQTGYVLGMVGALIVVMQGIALRPLLRLAPDRTLVLVGLATEFTGFTMLALSPGLGTMSTAALYMSNAVLAIGVGMTSPCLSACASKCAGQSEQGAALGTLMAAGSFGAVFGPVLAGALYQEIGHTVPYLVAAALTILTLTLAIRQRGLLRVAAADGDSPTAAG